MYKKSKSDHRWRKQEIIIKNLNPFFKNEFWVTYFLTHTYKHAIMDEAINAVIAPICIGVTLIPNII